MSCGFHVQGWGSKGWAMNEGMYANCDGTGQLLMWPHAANCVSFRCGERPSAARDCGAAVFVHDSVLYVVCLWCVL
jgi:hypothetical protein